MKLAEAVNEKRLAETVNEKLANAANEEKGKWMTELLENLIARDYHLEQGLLQQYITRSLQAHECKKIAGSDSNMIAFGNWQFKVLVCRVSFEDFTSKVVDLAKKGREDCQDGSRKRPKYVVKETDNLLAFDEEEIIRHSSMPQDALPGSAAQQSVATNPINSNTRMATDPISTALQSKLGETAREGDTLQSKAWKWGDPKFSNGPSTTATIQPTNQQNQMPPHSSQQFPLSSSFTNPANIQPSVQAQTQNDVQYMVWGERYQYWNSFCNPAEKLFQATRFVHRSLPSHAYLPQRIYSYLIHCIAAPCKHPRTQRKMQTQT